MAADLDSDAVRLCELAVAAEPADPSLHHRLAQAHSRLLEAANPEAKLAAIIAAVPHAYTSLLYLARMQEVRGDLPRAVISYARALRTAYASGFWLDPDSTPPWLHTAVRHAHDVAHRGAAAMFEDWLRPLRERYGTSELARVEKCVAMYTGTTKRVLADPRQQPSFLYFPDLPVTPVFERDALAFAEELEDHAEAIRDEALRVVEANAGVQPFHYDVPAAQRGKLTDGAWDAYFFYDEGERDLAHHAACPQTSAMLARMPLDHVRDHGPEVCFSVLRPGAKILPHRGITNTRVVFHLGLEVPDDCALDVIGVQEVHWQRGRCFAFDDTFEHQAWNRSDRTRVVLLGDIWNPHLREPERVAIAELVALIGDFNREVAPRTRSVRDPTVTR